MPDYFLYGDAEIPAHLKNRVQGELDQDEQLLWIGQPQPGRMARKAIPLMIFGIPFTAFALFWMTMASGILFVGGNADFGPGIFLLCFPLFGIPFVVVGLGLLTAPFWAYRNAGRTCYAVTSKRVILWEAGWFGSITVRSYLPPELTKIFRREHSDGTGDLIFEEYYTYGRRGRSHLNHRGFLAIERVREIEELIRKTLLT
jgi:hypothetical protein